MDVEGKVTLNRSWLSSPLGKLYLTPNFWPLFTKVLKWKERCFWHRSSCYGIRIVLYTKK